MSAKPLASPPPLLWLATVVALYALLAPIAWAGADLSYELTRLGGTAPSASVVGDLLSPPMLVALVSLAPAAPIWRLLRTLSVPDAGRWTGLMLLLPSSVLLGRGDALWTAPCLMTLDAAIRRRHGPLLLWCGLAVALAPQAALFAPFVAAVLIHRRVNPALWLLAPVSYVAAVAPAALLGWPVPDATLIPLHHAADVVGAPNIWFLVEALLPGIMPQLGGLVVVGVVGVSACYVAHFSTRLPGAGVRLLPVALLAELVSVGVLPQWHEASLVIAGVIALVWAVASQERRAWQVAVLIQAGSTLTIAGNLFGQAALVVAGFVVIALATWRTAMPLARAAANDNEASARVWLRVPAPRQPAKPTQTVLV